MRQGNRETHVFFLWLAVYGTHPKNKGFYYYYCCYLRGYFIVSETFLLGVWYWFIRDFTLWRLQEQFSYKILNRKIISFTAHNIFPISKPTSHHHGWNSLEYFHCNAVNRGHSGGAVENCWRPLYGRGNVMFFWDEELKEENSEGSILPFW